MPAYPIFLTDAHNKTAELVAREFAETHWDEPRCVSAYSEDNTFTLVDGFKLYRVVHQPGVPGVSFATFGVIVVEKETGGRS